MLTKLLQFFDKLEDRARSQLSHTPLLYAFLGGIGVILFWRGIWHLADDANISSGLSLLIGGLVLLTTGVFVSSFIGDHLIISGLFGEKKLTEKTEKEIEIEEMQIKRMQSTLNKVEEQALKIESEIERHHHNK